MKYELALDVDLTAVIRLEVEADDLEHAKRLARSTCELMDAVSFRDMERAGATITEMTLNLPPDDEFDSQPRVFEINGEDVEEEDHRLLPEGRE
jgi:hypothetical protein